MSDNTWLGGKIKKTVKDSVGADLVVDDLIMGMVDFQTGTTSISTVTGQVKKVVFGGYISNELNERSVTFDYVREEREWKIEDGSRVDVPYSLEELEDAKALMDIDLYKKTYNNLSDYLVQMEDSQVLSWLDEMYNLYKGVEVDMLGIQNKRLFQAGIVCGKCYFFFVVILVDGERKRVFADIVRNLHTRLSRIEPHIGINHDPDDRIRRRCRDIRVVDQVYPRCRVGYRHDGGGIGGVMEFKRTGCSIKLLSFIVERQVLSSRRVFHLLLYNLQLPGLGTD